MDQKVRDDNKRIDVKPDVVRLVSGMLRCLRSMTCTRCMRWRGSLKFDTNASSSDVSFGDKRIRIWCPSGSIDDSTLEELPGDLTLDGMKTEIGNLESMQCCDLLTESEIGESRRQFRVIPSRWVTTRKPRRRRTEKKIDG